MTRTQTLSAANRDWRRRLAIVRAAMLVVVLAGCASRPKLPEPLRGPTLESERLGETMGKGERREMESASGRVVPVAPPGGSAVSALAWNDAGTHLAFGTEAGGAGLVDLSKR